MCMYVRINFNVLCTVTEKVLIKEGSVHTGRVVDNVSSKAQQLLSH